MNEITRTTRSVTALRELADWLERPDDPHDNNEEIAGLINEALSNVPSDDGGPLGYDADGLLALILRWREGA